EMKYFSEDFLLIDTEEISNIEYRTPNIEVEKMNSEISLIHNALILGIKDYFAKMNFSKAILGLSGGVDSALVLALAVRALEKEIIPKHILTKAPSAELRPNQKDSDSLPEYPILDKILFEYIENRQGPKELVAMGFEKGLVDRILKLVNTNEWKRAQFAPVL